MSAKCKARLTNLRGLTLEADVLRLSYSSCSNFRDLQNLRAFAPLQTQDFANVDYPFDKIKIMPFQNETNSMKSCQIVATFWRNMLAFFQSKA